MPGWRRSRPSCAAIAAACWPSALRRRGRVGGGAAVRALRLQPAASQEPEGRIDGDARGPRRRSRLDAQHHQRPRARRSRRRADRAPARGPAGSVARRHARAASCRRDSRRSSRSSAPPRSVSGPRSACRPLRRRPTRSCSRRWRRRRRCCARWRRHASAARPGIGGAAPGRRARSPAQAAPDVRAAAATAVVLPLGVMLERVRALLQAGPVTIEQLPARHRRRLDRQRRPRPHPGLPAATSWRPTIGLWRFARAVQAVAPDATGVPISIRAAGDSVVAPSCRPAPSRSSPSR